MEVKFSSFERKLAEKIEPELLHASPGVQIQAFQAGRKWVDISLGRHYPYYDLASLTKIIFTTQAALWAFQNGAWSLESRISDFLTWFPDPNTRVLQLLNHSSGLPWWLPAHESMGPEDWHERLPELVRTCSMQPNSESVYSDVGFWVLGFILEKLYDKDLLEIWREVQELFYPRLSFEFHPGNHPLYPVEQYAPTERCLRRGQLQGQVHDDNAYAFGGVAAHAGLFGSIDDVSWFGLFLRGQLQGISKTLIKQKTAQLFATRSRPPGAGDWALGYMMPTQGRSSSGDFFSPYSIGHTGFTGTSFWYDPIQDLMVVILSNRVAFGRENENFKKLRPRIHNWIVEGLRRGSFSVD